MGRNQRGRVAVHIPGTPGLYQPARLVGWDVVGTVTVGVGETGALVRNQQTGIYCMANAGYLGGLGQAGSRGIGGKGPLARFGDVSAIPTTHAMCALTKRTPCALRDGRSEGYGFP